jgi:hypothetical protein
MSAVIPGRAPARTRNLVRQSPDSGFDALRRPGMTELKNVGIAAHPPIVMPASGSAERRPDDRLRPASSNRWRQRSNREAAAYWIVRSSRTMTAFADDSDGETKKGRDRSRPSFVCVPRMLRSALGSAHRAARAQAPRCAADPGSILPRVGPGSAKRRKRAASRPGLVSRLSSRRASAARPATT